MSVMSVKDISKLGGKIENCVNNVALSYSDPGFSCLLDAQLYLPENWGK